MTSPHDPYRDLREIDTPYIPGPDDTAGRRTTPPPAPVSLPPQPRGPRRPIMFALAAIAAVLLLGVGALAAASAVVNAVTKPDIAACKAAMREQYRSALADAAAGREAARSSRPDECKGVDDATLQRLADEVLSEEPPDSLPAS